MINKTGPAYVWNQQKNYLETQDDDHCPRAAFTQDLQKAIQEWLDKGEQIVLMLDANDDIRTGKFAQAMRDIGLTEATTLQHGNAGPPTFLHGSDPIDGIFISPSIQNTHSGYLPVQTAFNHRILWIHIPDAVAFGYPTPELVHPAARCLKCSNPRVVNAYITALQKTVESEHLLDRARNLQEILDTGQWRTENTAEWERLDHDMTIAKLAAERQCRKFKMGQIEWSPALSHARIRIDAWHAIRRYILQQNKHNSRVAIRKARKAEITTPLRLITPEQASQELSDAYETQKEVKKKAQELRDTWIGSLAAAKAEAGNTTAETEIRMMRVHEEQRKAARVIR